MTTNPLIPYSFVPGTKAKAQEVNANFLSLAEEITDNKAYYDEQIASLKTTDETTNTSIETTNAEVEKKLGYQHLTNCILSAPNGVAEYKGNTLTIKKGLKVLIPDGYNEDGSLKNIEYTLEDDVSSDITGLSNGNYYFYISLTNEAAAYYIQGTFEQSNDPVGYTGRTTRYLWFDKSANRYKESTDSGNTWTDKSYCKIGFMVYADGMICSIEPDYNLELMKMASMSNYVLQVLPDFGQPIYHAAGTFARFTNGWLHISAGPGTLNILVTVDGKSVFQNSGEMKTKAFVPVPRGATYIVKVTSGTVACGYYPSKGG